MWNLPEALRQPGCVCVCACVCVEKQQNPVALGLKWNRLVGRLVECIRQRVECIIRQPVARGGTISAALISVCPTSSYYPAHALP